MKAGDTRMLVRPADLSDATALAALHLDVWEDAYTGLIPQHLLDSRRAAPQAVRVARWAERLESSGNWVAEIDGELIGFATAGPGRDGDGDEFELMALYVRAAHWGKGVGKRLLSASVGPRPVYLWVLAGNNRAITFYRRQGFHFDGRVKDTGEGLHRRMIRPPVHEVERSTSSQPPGGS